MKSQQHGGRKPSKVSKTIAELLKEDARDDLIVTKPYNEFLSTWDENWSPRVVKRMTEVLSERKRDRRYSWSGSGAGRCKRRQEFAFMGMPVTPVYDPQLRRIFLNGTFVHLRNQAVKMEAEILDNIEVTIKHKKTRTRCTMDGMGVAKVGRYAGAEFGYELKSTNENSYNWQVIKGATDNTRSQVDFEFMLSGFDVFVIFNENKNNQGTQEWVIIRDEDRVKEMRKDVKELNAAIDNMKLHPKLPECQKKLKSGEWEKCPYGGDGGVCATAGNWPSKIPPK